MLKHLITLAVALVPFSSSSAEPIAIKIGATLPLTGRLAIAGQDARKGIELALAEFSTPAVTLTAVFDDNQHDAKQAAASAQKLINIEKVDAIISMWDMADVVAPLAEQHKIPHLAVRWDPHITEKFNYTFTFESTYRSYVDSLIALLRKQGVASVALLSEEGQGWLLSSDYLLKQAPAGGISVVGDERYTPGSTDYRSVVLRTVRNHPDMVILLSNPPHTELLIKELCTSVPGQRFTGYFEIIDPAIVEGIPFVAQFQVAPWFATKFQERYGEPPRSRAAQMYDIIHLLALSAASGKIPTPAAIESALRELPAGDGAAGHLFANSPRVIESSCVWKIARQGKFELYSQP